MATTRTAVPAHDLLVRIEWTHGILVLGTAAAGLWFGGTSLAASVLFGGGLIWANVWLFKRLFSSVVASGPGRHRLAIALLFAKLPLLWALAWWVATWRLIQVDGVGLAAGITCLPAAVVFVTLFGRPDPEHNR